MRSLRNASVSALCLLAACGPAPTPVPANTMLDATTHAPRFPIAAGSKHALGSDTPAIACNSCHGAFDTFRKFDCVSCHAHSNQAALDQAHHGLAGYAYASASCYSCHPHGTAAGTLPSGTVSDPARAIDVDALIPSYIGSTISSLTQQRETLPMPMDHGAPHLASAALSSCGNCHVNAATGPFRPGVLHASLANLGLAQPTQCLDCHSTSMPIGFVGPTAINPVRRPASGEMKHDAVAWTNGAPTQASIVPTECALCHAGPADSTQSWRSGIAGASGPLFHASLSAAGLPQPSSCVDCHANTNPLAVLTSSSAALPANVSFDHADPSAVGDCATCHAASAAAAQWASWSGGRHHQPGDATPTSCLPCHGDERPTATTGWIGTAYQNSPFDYVTNGLGVSHGAGQDCAVCHTGPGTGSWGGTPAQNWLNGHFAHGPTTIANTSCVTCHSTQRPDLQTTPLPADMTTRLNGFNHAANGPGDCFGCHQNTVIAGNYVAYDGDWQGGRPYPGATLVGSTSTSLTLTEIALSRVPSTGFITGQTSTVATFYSDMLHVSAAIPSQASPGPADNPDNSSCWHCHVHASGSSIVTSFGEGRFHTSLDNFSATPNGAAAPLPQPTQCLDCHAQMRPSGIVELAASNLVPMDHAALFVGPATINGASVSGVGTLECAVCHKSTSNWSGALFHSSIASAVPADCTACHYPLMADSPHSDLTSGTNYSMKHASAQVPLQTCQTCHTGALGAAKATPVASVLWNPGALHASLTSQPSACLDCHAISEPAANASTTSSTNYTFANGGGTTSNGAQWMNHGSADVVGKDCVLCHSADAQASGSAWSKSDSFHSVVASPSACKGCHGVTNGGGAALGTNNNLPAGISSTRTLTMASNDPSTGVAVGTADQINHADVNVSSHDCNFCHAQVGRSSVAGVQGKEWAQASFHANFVATGMTLSSTTGRCSNCHLNVKPGAAFSIDHSTFSNAAGSEDCATCHTFPGTGTNAAPNWYGGRHHQPGDPAPTTCMPCHAAERPTTTTNWTSATYRNSPFDYVTNAQGVSHGAGQDCVVCHTGPGTGSWGGTPTQNWLNGHFAHGPTTIANNACVTCHSTQRPDLQTTALPSDMTTRLNGFNHATNGPGDCFGCHQSTVIAGNYVAYDGDWQGGRAYPGATLVGSTSTFVSVTEIALSRTLSTGFITGQTSSVATLYTQMLHTSAAIPSQASPGPANSPDNTSCWHCHTHASGSTLVTAFGGGRFHTSLDNFSATPGGTVTPLAQPSTQCLDCHAQMRPIGIVELGGSDLQPMDHAAIFTGPAVINGASVAGVGALECAVCHSSTSNWSGALFHSSIAAAVPADCTACHYPLMADAPRADLTSGTNYSMKHASVQMPLQTCQTCHTTALGAAKTTPIASTLWNPGAFHASVASQPSTCLDCHAISEPAANASTTSSTNYTFANGGGTSSNGAQWLNHGSGDVAGKDCVVCHSADARASGSAWNKSDSFHSIVTNPAACKGCHGVTNGGGAVLGTNNNLPAGLSNSRTLSMASSDPSTGVAVGTADQINHADINVSSHDCNFCHTQAGRSSVAGVQGKEWAQASFHANLVLGGLTLSSTAGRCSNCHMNVRPGAAFAIDHSTFTNVSGSEDCATCHTFPGTGTNSAPNWYGGRHHLPGDPAPTTCLPCHSAERPTTTTNWTSATYQNSPFDYVTNAQGVSHGAGQDCVVCHPGPGTGSWGGTPTQNWLNGHFAHGPTTIANTACITCHSTQRPDLQTSALPADMVARLNGFNHATGGPGDCFACHQNTVVAGNYAAFDGDWQGGRYYPGATLIGTSSTVVSLTEISLTRTLGTGFITGQTSSVATLYTEMLHTSGAIPSQVNPGPVSAPDNNSCWHCHTHSSGSTVVSSYSGGLFHASLTNYAATPGGTVTPLAQPSQCLDCHAQMRPAGIVELAASDLQPMDHGALFTAATTINGASVTGVGAVECAVCHKSTSSWSAALFHSNIAAGVPAGCTACHYPLMADAARSDLTSGTNYVMKHASAQMPLQTCQSCHTTALGAAKNTPIASALWNPGAFHASLTSQPSACLDCHAVSEPAANVSTTSSTVYSFASTGGTASNGAQWMNHGSADVVGKDCVLCHAADARQSGSAWSKSDLFHSVVTSPAACKGCHGVTNGGGAVLGTNNNLPSGLSNSTTLTMASNDVSTGVAVGTPDQINHADINVSNHDCNFCHTQAGRSSVVGVQGKEWAQANFHANMVAGGLTLSASTGRCSNCHMNVKPGVAFATDHSTFTSVSGSEDCATCHTFPGTGTNSAPNWYGASNVPLNITVGGFTIPVPPAAAANTIQSGIASLPHPTVVSPTTCASCHTGGIGAKNAIGYDHASTLIKTNCNSCHESGSNLVGTVWNGATTQATGAGDTRPFTLTTLSGGGCTLRTPGTHFYPSDCTLCHKAPTGISVVATTSTALQTAWSFTHPPKTDSTSATPCSVCHVTNNCGN